ncbi:MAG: hypothetical protein K0S61_3151 [Anaerocolumna sp.]|jgi:ABC-2 type transport system permease protein|nr:hypothetical protein [Anaerocolumna sp.]
MTSKDRDESNNITTVKAKANHNLLWLLVKNRLIAQLGIHIFRYEKDKRKKDGKIATTIALVFCAFMLVGYCGALACGYTFIGLTELIPGIAMVISSLFTLFFTIFKANGELFHYRDYDTLMSLPIPVKTVINSRFLNMYLWNTFITILVMFPMGIVYMISTKPSIVSYFIWVIGIILTSLIPTTLAAIIGAVITAISVKFKYSNAVTIILSLVLIIAIFALPMSATSNNGLSEIVDTNTGNLDISTMKNLAPVITQTINKIYPPAKLFTISIVELNVGSFLLFVGVSIGWYVIFLCLLSLKYKQINTALTSYKTSSKFVLKTLQQTSMLKALYKKTLMRILKSNVCATNLLVSCLLALVFSVTMAIFGPENIQASLDIKDFKHILDNASAYIIAGMVCMTNSSIVSLSLEGRNIWLIKSLPIPPKTLYDSYLLTNFTFTFPTSLVCSILFCISLRPGLLGTFILLVTPIIYSVFTSVIGIYISNRMAFYDWQDETGLIKQSALSLIGILGGMVFLFLCGVFANIGIIPIKPNFLTLIMNTIVLIITVLIYKNESTRPIKD